MQLTSQHNGFARLIRLEAKQEAHVETLHRVMSSVEKLAAKLDAHSDNNAKFQADVMEQLAKVRYITIGVTGALGTVWTVLTFASRYI
jgi:chromosome segregation ATPase